MNSLSRIWDIPLLLLLSLIWASAFTMIKIAVPWTGPVLLVLIRCGIGAAVMLVLVAMRGASWPKDMATMGWPFWLGHYFDRIAFLPDLLCGTKNHIRHDRHFYDNRSVSGDYLGAFLY